MDIAYDHIQEELLPADEDVKGDKKDAEPTSLNNEIQDAYKAISNSPWATKLGGILGSVKKQGEHYYEEARQEYNQASEQAAKGFSSIVSRTRALSLNQSQSSSTAAAAAANDDQQTTTEPASTAEAGEAAERPESLPADIVREAESMLSKLKSEAAKRLKDIEKAEDAADEALYKFGTNVRNFLRDAVTVVPPSGKSSTDDLLNNNPSSTVIFESKDAEGKRVLHTTRFDAQLHAIHSNIDTFLKDPDSERFPDWAAEFDIEKQTETIAKDLEKYEELKQAMERLVPEKVEYGQFWKRYYFLRHVIETEEKRRKELLKGATMAATEEEEVSWDNDSSSDDGDDTNNNNNITKTRNQSSTTPTSSSQPNPETKNPSTPLSSSSSSSTTMNTAAPISTSSNTQPQPNQENDDNNSSNEKANDTLLKPTESNRKHSGSSNTSSLSSSITTTGAAGALNDQNSQADSDASYDLVSGTTSRAPESPGEEKNKRDGTVVGVGVGVASGGGSGDRGGVKSVQQMTGPAVAGVAGTTAATAEDSDDDWE